MAKKPAVASNTGRAASMSPPQVERAVHDVEGRSHDSPERQATALHMIPREIGLVGGKEGKLDAPPARPGMTQRWVRVRLRDNSDRKNLDTAIRAGFRPRLADTVPESLSPSTTELGGFSYVGVDDVVLMERPENFERLESQKNEEAIQRTMVAVYRQLQDSQQPGGPRMRVGHETEVTRGKRRVTVKGDNPADDVAFFGDDVDED